MNDAATTLREQTIDPQVAGARVARMYARHGRTLYGLCRMLLRDAHEAEDALQSTFLSAHRALTRGGAPRDEAAWLVTIARNECRGRIRARMEAPVAGDVDELDVLADPGPSPDERLADPTLQRALESLPDRQREAVVLHDALGLRSREVATALGMSTPAVEALLFRARRQLRLRLSPAGTLVLPATVGAALAQAIPGFVAPAVAGVTGATGSVAGAGILAKLAGAPATAKVVAGVAAAATAGSVAVVDATREPVPAPPGHVAIAGGSNGATSERPVEAAGGEPSTTPGAGRPAPHAAGTSDEAAERGESPAGRDEGPADSREGPAAPSSGEGGDAADDGGEHDGGSRGAQAAGSDDEAEDQSVESDDSPARVKAAVETETNDDGDDDESAGSRARSVDEGGDSSDDADTGEDGSSSGSGSEGSDVELDDRPDEPDPVELDPDEPDESEDDG